MTEHRYQNLEQLAAHFDSLAETAEKLTVGKLATSKLLRISAMGYAYKDAARIIRETVIEISATPAETPQESTAEAA